MSVNIYGYVRVSTREQNEDHQFIAMNGLAIPKKNLFMDKQSGKDFKRSEYKKLVKIQTGRFALHQEHRPAGAQP